MGYKELADLIFPDAKDVSYYEEKYPERNLKEGAIVTRFACENRRYRSKKRNRKWCI